MEENNNKIDRLAQRNFVLGLSVGVAFVSTLCMVILFVYLFSSGGISAKENSANTGGEEAVSAAEFKECLESGKYTQKVKSDQSLGSQLGVSGTPAFFINGYYLSGAQPLSVFQNVIDTVLKGETPTQTSDGEEVELQKVQMPNIGQDDHVKGASSPAVTIYEFSDFECPFCARGNNTIQQILGMYSQANLVFKHYPLSFHPSAQIAAEASECAAEQDKFWEMHDELFKLNASQTLSESTINEAAEELGLQ